MLLPRLLDWLSDTPDPDIGLLAYRRISEALAERRWFLGTLRDDAVAKRLMRVLGTSAFVQLLMRAPEVIRSYADGPAGPKLLDVEPEGVARALIASAGRHRSGAGHRRRADLRRRELARVASADLLGMLDVREVCTALTSVWVAVLRCALEAVIRANTPAGEAPPAAIAVIGMGRLGGGELGYGSDADVMFVCEPAVRTEQGGADETRAVKWVSVAEQLRGLLGAPSDDPPLEVDANLRPEGRNGALVRTLSSYAAYYAQWAQQVEPRHCCAPHRWQEMRIWAGASWRSPTGRFPDGGISPDAVREIRRIKARVDMSSSRGEPTPTHTKLGRGGLADVEWTVQLLQLRHAHEVPGLHNTSTLETLDAIAAADLISGSRPSSCATPGSPRPGPATPWCWCAARQSTSCPDPDVQLNAVAVAASWSGGDGGEFLDNYLRVTRRAKAVVNKVFGG